MPARGGDDARFAQARYPAPDDDRIGVDEGRELFGGQRPPARFRHVDEHVQGGGKSAVSFHVTKLVTNLRASRLADAVISAVPATNLYEANATPSPVARRNPRSC